MEFRWIAILTLWTLLIGPVLDNRHGPMPSSRSSVSAAKTTKTRN